MVHETELFTLDDPVSAPDGIVYSTSPRRAEGRDGYSYFLKGPEPEIVFPELAGCSFAAEVGLIVPSVAVCEYEGARYCGSRKVAESLRDVAAWLNRLQKIINRDDLYNVIIVDAWLANNDRNLGNVLGRSSVGSEIEVIMIDFEKSKTLRPSPLIESGGVSPKALWPTGDLGNILRASKPMHPPAGIIEEIHGFTQQRCEEIVHDIVTKFGPVAWAENSVLAVSRRAAKVHDIAGEIWRQN